VKAIVAMIGGDHSCHLLPLLDIDLIREHPTILMGYSGVTVLNVAIWAKTGLVTFNGSALMVELAEYPKVFDYTERHTLKTLCSAEPVDEIEPSGWWTEEFLDWGEKEDLTLRAPGGLRAAGRGSKPGAPKGFSSVAAWSPGSTCAAHRTGRSWTARSCFWRPPRRSRARRG
jgi:hypothetical protein